MKLSTFREYHAHPFDLPVLKKLKAIGFDGIDFCFHPTLLADGKEDFIIEEIRENFEKAGLVCSQVHLPFYDLTLPSDCYSEFVERQMRFAFKAMTVLGAKWGAWHPVSAMQANHDRKIAMKDNKEKLKRHLETAEKYGVGIAVENIFAPLLFLAGGGSHRADREHEFSLGRRVLGFRTRESPGERERPHRGLQDDCGQDQDPARGRQPRLRGSPPLPRHRKRAVQRAAPHPSARRI